jgi:hypothetical protein
MDITKRSARTLVTLLINAPDAKAAAAAPLRRVCGS